MRIVNKLVIHKQRSLTEYMLDNWEGKAFIVALSWNSITLYWMIDIITTIAVGDHVCFVDRIVIIFISLPEFIISSLWFAVKLMLVILLTWSLAIVWNGRWYCECRWAYVGLHFCSRMHFLIQSCFGSSCPILLLLSCYISGVADWIYFSIFSVLPWWLAACNRVLFIAAGGPQEIKMKFSVTRNRNTPINDLCNMRYCLPISDLL